MLRQSIFTVIALFAFAANAETEKEENPISNYVNEQIEILELELELFGTPTDDETIAIESLYVYEPEEDVDLGFDTKHYLPDDFDAAEGMTGIDWGTIEIYEIEEEVEFDFKVEAYLPKGFNPYEGMTTINSEGICFF